MVPIRKRRQLLAASFSRKQVLHESGNGGLHLYAGPKSNPNFEDPKLSSLSSPTIIKEDHLLVAVSGYGLIQRPVQKQVPAEAAAVLKRKPYSFASSEVKPKMNCESVIAMKGGGNSRAMMDHVQEYEGKHMHMYHGDDDDDAKCMGMKVVSKEAGLSETSDSYTGREDKVKACCKKASYHGAVPCITELPCSDPVRADATRYPRKVLPLQLILMSSESRRSNAAKIPAHNSNNNKLHNPTQYLTGSGSTVSTPSEPDHMPHRDKDSTEEKKASPTTCRRKALGALPSSAGGSSKTDVPENAGVKLQDEMKLRSTAEDANRGSLNSGDQSLERPVSSWQGYRRARSFLQGGRCWASFNETPDPLADRCCPGVNAQEARLDQQQCMRGFVSEEENQSKIETKEERKKAMQMKRKPVMKTRVETLGRLKLQESTAMESENSMKKRADQSLQSTTQDVPIPAELLGSVIRQTSKVGSKKRKRPILFAGHTDDDPDDLQNVAVIHVASASAAAHDHSEPDFMRCRRKDGRRWRCREQVVKPGAPFCHYHTLKMREKHAASVARRLPKKLQREANDPECSRSGKASKRGRGRSSPTISMAKQERYGAGIEGCYQEEDEETEEEGEEDEEEGVEAQHVHAKLGKQLQVKVVQEAASLTTAVKRRWRKKCKPSIRRLNDIHDRARPAAKNGHDSTTSFWEDTSDASPATGLPSPLPECLLNTDPNEWRSDFP